MHLEVEIQYLAERINPSFTKFQVVVFGVDSIYFTTWPNDSKLEPQVIVDVDEIFKPELEILEGNILENKIQVVCNQSSPTFKYCGGELYFKAESALVTDEAGKSYSIEELSSLCKSYWDDWANKNKS